MPTDNPNEYDDDAFLQAGNAFQSSTHIQRLWQAGATLDDIADEIATYIENVLNLPAPRVTVTT